MDDQKAKYKNTRRMAWLCLVTSLCYPLLLLTGAGDKALALAPTFFTFTGAVVVAFTGIANARDGWGKQ